MAAAPRALHMPMASCQMRMLFMTRCAIYKAPPTTEGNNVPENRSPSLACTQGDLAQICSIRDEVWVISEQLSLGTATDTKEAMLALALVTPIARTKWAMHKLCLLRAWHPTCKLTTIRVINQPRVSATHAPWATPNVCCTSVARAMGWSA